MIERDLIKGFNVVPKHPNSEIQSEIELYQKNVEAINKLEFKLRATIDNQEDKEGLEENILLAKNVRDNLAIELEKKGVSTEGLKPNPEINNVN